MIKRQQRERQINKDEMTRDNLRNKERRINIHHNNVLKTNERQTDK
jgi:hypothetical protein